MYAIRSYYDHRVSGFDAGGDLHHAVLLETEVDGALLGAAVLGHDYTIQMNAQAFGLDPAQVRRAFERAATEGDDAAVLQREVEQRMFERLDS